MSSAALNPLPPHVTHSTTRLTHLQAHTLLADFLNTAENDAAYRPDSTLTERGPQAVSSGNMTNLTLSHLKRICLGIEGKRVGGGFKVEGEEDVVEDVAEAEGQIELGETETVNAFDEDELETPTQQQSKKSKKRTLDDLTSGPDSSQTPQPKKQKQNQSSKIISTANGEGISNPTNGTVLTAPETDDWQDPDTFALAQNEINTTDLARPETDVVFEGSGQNDGGGEDELAFEDFDGPNEIEEDRHPGANLPQPHSEQEERDLVSIRLEGTGEVVDPREPSTRVKSKKKDKKKQKEIPGHVETSPVVPSSTVSRREKKKDNKSKPANADNNKPPRSSSSIAIPSSQPSKTTTPSKAAIDNEATSRALSKDERKRLKKLKQKDTKKDREEGRLKRKAGGS